MKSKITQEEICECGFPEDLHPINQKDINIKCKKFKKKFIPKTPSLNKMESVVQESCSAELNSGKDLGIRPKNAGSNPALSANNSNNRGDDAILKELNLTNIIGDEGYIDFSDVEEKIKEAIRLTREDERQNQKKEFEEKIEKFDKELDENIIFSNNKFNDEFKRNEVKLTFNKIFGEKPEVEK